MSESSFPFEGQPVADAAASPEPGTGKGNRTMLFAAGGVAVALVLGALAYFLVFAGGGEDVPEGAVVRRPVAAKPVPVPTTAPVKQDRISAKSFGRDPFEPRISEPVAVALAAPAVATAPGTGTGTTAVPVATDPGTSTPTSTEAHSFRVVEVAPDNSTITVKVDGREYTDLRAGEIFATYFKVILISGEVNSFQYGEEKFNVLGTKRLTIA